MMEERPSYVTFEVRAVEDRNASREAGHYVAKDIDVALITPPGGNLTHEEEATAWLEKKREKRDPFADLYEKAYKAWKEGQELPVHGTPIKHTPIFSPAEIQNCIHAKVFTVEDLIAASEQTIQRLGMGARSMITRAKAYMDNAESGKVAAQMEAMTARLEAMESELAKKDARIAELEEAKPKRGRPPKEAA